MGATLLAISTQDQKSHAAFAKKLKANYPVLADSDQKVSEAYGVLMKPMGMAARVTYIIGPDGRIAAVDDKVNFKTAGTDLIKMLKQVDTKSTASAPQYPGWPTNAPVQTTANGLQYQDVTVGTGASPRIGSPVVVQYTGYLTNGTMFDSSYDRNQPFTFTLGVGQVIKGWDEGVATMKVGGKRKLIVPPDLGYGAAGTPGGPIPPNATLVFDVELLDVPK